MKWGVNLLGLGGFGFLYLPLVVVGVLSFNQARYGLVWTGFTGQWYGRLFQDAAIAQAAQNTLVLALSSTLISTVLGTLLGYGLFRMGRSWLEGLLYLPVVVPDVILGIGFLLFYKLLRQYTGFGELGLGTMITGHVTVQLAFVALVVRSRLVGLDPALLEAAQDLYADTWATLRHVVLPLAWPGILAGALLAFTLSVDDFVLSFFTSGPDSTTLPVLIYSTVRRGITPEIHALSTVMVLGTLVLTLLARRVRG